MASKTNQENQEHMQMLDYQMRQISQVLEKIDEQIADVNATKNALTEYAALKGNEELFFPLANGIFVKGRITDTKTVRMNIGSNVVVEKSMTDAIAMMQKQYDEIMQYREQLTSQLEMLGKKLSEMESKKDD